MKRFYKHVRVQQIKQGHQVLLDDKPVKTPLQNILFLPTNKLAEAVAREWGEQNETLDMSSMPLTNLAYTWQDKILLQKETVIETLVAYLETELICYPCPEPPDLYKKQECIWQPIADWFQTKTNITLNSTTDILKTAQNDTDVENFKKHLSKMPEVQLTIMQSAIAILGSAVISYALAKGHINAKMAFEAGLIEEIFQAEKWGLDPATENKHQIIKNDLHHLDAFLALATIPS